MIWRSVTLISCGIIGGWLGWMASDRQVPVKYLKSEVLNDPVFVGGVLRVKNDVWRDRSCKLTIFRIVFDNDSHRFVVPDLVFPASVLPTGGDVFVVPIPISPEAHPGLAIYRAFRRYECNWLHRIWPIEDGPSDLKFMISE